MRRTKAEADKTRQDLIRSAWHIFSHKGYAETRLSDIAKEAGVTRGPSTGILETRKTF